MSDIDPKNGRQKEGEFRTPVVAHSPPKWELDKKVPIIPTIGFIVTVGAVVWAGGSWVRSIESVTNANRDRIAAIEITVKEQGILISGLLQESARTQAKLDNLADGQRRIEDLITRAFYGKSVAPEK